MPSQRKRIGFLPRAEVQNLIDQICKHNKLSQSKVTGILVEEALSSRGVLKSFKNNLSDELNCNINKKLLITNDAFKKETLKDHDTFILNERYMKDEVKMINDFIEFRFFKNIMKRNKKNM